MRTTGFAKGVDVEIMTSTNRVGINARVVDLETVQYEAHTQSGPG